MKIYDTFIFNDELHILELRLLFLNDDVDFFVLIESKRTLSGLRKPLHFYENRHLFQKYLSKIIYLEAPVNNMPAWEYEYFQRNYIKKALENCQDEDWILISDVDELVNISEVLKHVKEKKPYLIELPMYYYWLNVKTNETFIVNVFSPWKFLRHINIGERYYAYPKIFTNIITSESCNTGWHFSYLYGRDVVKYQNKILSFSHQEFNTPYFLKPRRILRCINLCVDIFERSFMLLKFISKDIEPLKPAIKQLKLEKYLFTPSTIKWMIPGNIIFMVKITSQNFLRKTLIKVKQVKRRIL